jgi:hypothetical protein
MEQERTKEETAMLEAIRNDPKIGRGSCSMVDECMEDEEILEELRRAGATTPEEALREMKGSENVWRDRADDVLGAGGEKPIWGQVS